MRTERGRELEKMEHRCVECGFPIKTLFVQYSPGNIRLMRCENCKAVADEYIECEFMADAEHIDSNLQQPEISNVIE
ncbi:unnamed protein product [Dovyalis caffra]|uniref:Protein ARV n=1 Tax=Dovyalis caffra TaxID=77055 RepID=A0AAV1SB83_9ROSI|nr:unnamed protein product [Dovyalis caffra]